MAAASVEEKRPRPTTDLREYHKRYRQLNYQRLMAYGAAYRAAHRDELAAKSRKYYETHKHARKDWRESIRREFCIAFGVSKAGHPWGVCSCCGADLQKFGTISHLNRDGKEHRKYLTQTALYRAAVRTMDKSRFAAECYNCNLGAAWNGGVCPHKQGKVPRPE